MKRPNRSEVLVFASVAELRAWFEANHDHVDAAWIGYYRKGVDRRSISYVDAVDQALCFGWIDGITYRVDDEVTASRFTPRRKRSHWSAVNIGKVERLQAAGLMTDAGRRAFEAGARGRGPRTGDPG